MEDAFCPTCKSKLVIRNGKFGEFICCSKGSHGSFSIQDDEFFHSGEIGKMVSRMLSDDVPKASVSSISQISHRWNPPSLTQLVDREVSRFAGGFCGYDDFTDPSPNSCMNDNDYNDPDQWWNMSGF